MMKPNFVEWDFLVECSRRQSNPEECSDLIGHTPEFVDVYVREKLSQFPEILRKRKMFPSDYPQKCFPEKSKHI